MAVEKRVITLKAQAQDSNIEVSEPAKEIIAQADEAKLSLESFMLSTQRPDVIQQLCQQMVLGIKYMEHFSQHLDKYEDSYKKELKHYLVDRLQKCKELLLY